MNEGSGKVFSIFLDRVTNKIHVWHSPGLTKYELMVVEHGAACFSHLLPDNRGVSGAVLAEKIKQVYDVSNPKTAEVVRVLEL